MDAEIRDLRKDVHQIDADESAGMKVPVRIYANDYIISHIRKDRTLMQAMNAAKLPSIVDAMMVMPDGHEGYGFPVGGVAAFDAEEGIISPGAIGFDINCGVRLIRTNLPYEEVKPKIGAVMDALFRNVPSGVGSKFKSGFTMAELDRIALEGVEYAIKKGFGFESDIENTEERGCMEHADPSKVSQLAKKRGVQQLGTLGAGNHFLEVQRVEKEVDARLAKAYGLYEGQTVIMLHSGSRGYGHQVCSDFLATFADYQRKKGIELPDPELAYAFIGSREAENYLAAMRSAVNFAFTNRQIMTDSIRKAFSEVFGRSADALGMELLYDVAHNIAKLEEHEVSGKKRKLYVHRKGATRAFGPGRKEVPKAYREYGQPVLIPGSMGTASYVLAGQEGAMRETFGSSCHGSGRLMSRHQALREIPMSKTFGQLDKKGVEIRVRSRKLVSEEAMEAYKNVDDVVESIEGAGISRIVARLVPVGVAKG